jgi:hypothetical protein
LRRIVVEISAGGFDHLVTTVQFFSDREGFARVVFGVEPTSVYNKPCRVFNSDFKAPESSYGLQVLI